MGLQWVMSSGMCDSGVEATALQGFESRSSGWASRFARCRHVISESGTFSGLGIFGP